MATEQLFDNTKLEIKPVSVNSFEMRLSLTLMRLVHLSCTFREALERDRFWQETVWHTRMWKINPYQQR